MTITRTIPAARPTATVKLHHHWPFPVIVEDGKTYRVVQPKKSTAPKPQFEESPF